MTQTQLNIESYLDLIPGKIYNREYTGLNEACKVCNSKTTFEVVSVEKDKLVIYELFSLSGDTLSERHESKKTFTFPDRINAEYVVYECADEEKWYKHNVTMGIKEALDKKLIKIETIKRVFYDQSIDFIKRDPLTYHGHSGIRSFSLNTEPTPELPYLTSVTFIFKNTEVMKSEIRAIFPEAWFMFD